MTLAGKRIFITGGSRGIGLAIALRAAADGASVAIAQKPQTLIQNFQELFTQQLQKLKPQVERRLQFNAIFEMNSRLRLQLNKRQRLLGE